MAQVDGQLVQLHSLPNRRLIEDVVRFGVETRKVGIEQGIRLNGRGWRVSTAGLSITPGIEEISHRAGLTLVHRHRERKQQHLQR